MEKASKGEIGIFITCLDKYQTKIRALSQEEMAEILDLDASVFFNLGRFLKCPQTMQRPMLLCQFFLAKLEVSCMYQQVTLTVSDAVLKRAASLAAVVSRPVEKILSETLEIALPDVGSETLPPIEDLSDAEVLALSQAQMEGKQNSRLSLLLDNNQRGTLEESERSELKSLYQTYLRLWLRQSEALVEAVHRGLRQPLPS